MKQKLLFLTALIFIAHAGISQERDAGTIEVIPNIGYSTSFLNGDMVDELDSRSAVQFGVVGDYYFNEVWSVRSGFSYMSMGARVPGTELQLDYLNIPVHANWHFGGTRKWNLNFGLTPGFLLKAEEGGTDLGDYYKSFQLAIGYGIGYKIEISDSFSILIDGQGVFGITNILESEDFIRLNAGSSLNVGGVFAF